MQNSRSKKNHQTGSKPLTGPVFYEITVQGRLDQVWAGWFEGMTLTYPEKDKNGECCTLISGLVVDQPALYGLLTKIRDLNLILLSIRRSVPGTDSVEDVSIRPESPYDGER